LPDLIRRDAIGFGLAHKIIINNFISGWIFDGEKPSRIGEFFLEVENAKALSKKLIARSTRFRRGLDGVHMLIPQGR